MSLSQFPRYIIANSRRHSEYHITGDALDEVQHFIDAGYVAGRIIGKHNPKRIVVECTEAEIENLRGFLGDAFIIEPDHQLQQLDR